MDLAQITALVQSIVAAGPAIEQGIVSIEPYVEAVVSMIKNGGNPTDEEWAALEASLQVGSQALQDAATQAQSEIDAAKPATTE